MDDLIKIVKSLEDNGILIKGVTETFQNEIKEQKGGFLSMLLGTLDASLLKNNLTSEGAIATSHRQVLNKKGNGTNRVGEGVIRTCYGCPLFSTLQNNKMDF